MIVSTTCLSGRRKGDGGLLPRVLMRGRSCISAQDARKNRVAQVKANIETYSGRLPMGIMRRILEIIAGEKNHRKVHHRPTLCFRGIGSPGCDGWGHGGCVS